MKICVILGTMNRSSDYLINLTIFWLIPNAIAFIVDRQKIVEI